jgi:dihydroorotase
MTNSLLIKGGHIIDPGTGTDIIGNVLITDSKIAWVGEGEPPITDHAVFNADGLIVCPGFIDVHCHLRQPGFEDSETIATGTKAAARGGFTAVCCMPNTNPPLDNEGILNYLRTVAAMEGVVRVFPIGCVTKERKGEELVDLNELELAGAVAFSDDGSPVSSPEIMRRALEYSRDFYRPIIDHCENLFLTQGGQVNEGVVSLELGLRGIPASAEELIIQRDIDLVRETGGHLHIAHVSTRGSVEIIRNAKEQGVPVTAEVTPHHLTLTEEEVLGFNTSAKVNPPLRTKDDTKALLQGLTDGVIDIIATDHAPHAATLKDCDFTQAAFGISGLETALGSLVGLIHDSTLSVNILIEALTVAPARVLGYEKLGTLEVGAPADVAIFDLHKEWTVDPAQFASKGKNTPLAGKTLKGKVMATFYMGQPVFMDESLKISKREDYG